ILGFVVSGFVSCSWLIPGRRAQIASPEVALSEIIDKWSRVDSVAVLGFRDHWGKSPTSTDVLNQALLSALGRSGAVVNPDAGITLSEAPTMRYSGGQVLPTGWRDLTGSHMPRHGLVLAGQIREADNWTYLRLALADATTGELRDHGTTRISQGDLDQLVAAASADSAVATAPLNVAYHVVARRDDAGFAEMIDVSEGTTLIEGDRLQVRLQAAQDCEAYVFLYASEDGERKNLLEPQRIYEGRWTYAPGENSWTSFSEGDQVFTLYLLVARRIDEDRQTLWERLDELHAQAQIDRMSGLHLVDEALADYLQQTIAVSDSVHAIRAGDSIDLATEAETFAYSDGVVFEHQAENLQGSVILRAISFHVRWK
ncbi:MAG: hypothetical protein HOC05_21910, partial [Gemmatimonadetes bacterium]|nr:hypothetical protein [Gemmatimonadota bacterium]